MRTPKANSCFLAALLPVCIALSGCTLIKRDFDEGPYDISVFQDSKPHYRGVIERLGPPDTAQSHG